MNAVTMLLLVGLLASALLVVKVRHENRQEFAELQALEHDRNTLQADWSRMTIEKSTWLLRHSVAEDAQERLGMSAPRAEEIVTIQLDAQ